MPMPNRSPSDTDYFFDLPQVGRFVYGRRTFGDRLKIRAEYTRITKGFGESDFELSVMGTVVAQHIVLCVKAPAGWEDLEAMDASIDPDKIDAHLLALFDLVKEKEDSFRKKPDAGSEGKGTGNGANDGALVPAKVQSHPS